MKFTVTLDSTPATGDELVNLLRRAVESVRFNIGPEPLRFTTGPIYGGPDHDPASGERVGTWEIKAEPQETTSVADYPLPEGAKCVHCGLPVRRNPYGNIEHEDGYFQCGFLTGKRGGPYAEITRVGPLQSPESVQR